MYGTKEQIEEQRQRQMSEVTQQEYHSDPAYYTAFNRRYHELDPVPPVIIDDECPMDTDVLLESIMQVKDEGMWKNRNPDPNQRKTFYSPEEVIHCEPDKIPNAPGVYDIGDGWHYMLRAASGVWSRFRPNDGRLGHVILAEPDIFGYKKYDCPHKLKIINEVEKWTKPLGIEKWKVDFQRMPTGGSLQPHIDSTYWFTCSYVVQLKHATPVKFHDCRDPKYNGEYYYKKAAVLNITEEWHSVKNDDTEERMVMRVHVRDKSYREIRKHYEEA